jgi:hypothetical protein
MADDLPRTRRRSIHASRNLSRAPSASLRDRLFCKPICKPDTARQLETGETEPTERDGIGPVRRGHSTRERRLETRETRVVWLITQRSRVQIPPPLPSLQVRGLFRSWKGPSACAVCTELCTRPLRAPRRAGRRGVPGGRRSRRRRRTDFHRGAASGRLR